MSLVVRFRQPCRVGQTVRIETMRSPMLHRRFLRLWIATGIVAGSCWHVARDGRAAPPSRVTTYTYKRVDNLKIKADVHRPRDEHVRPVVVWIHGGGLIMGGRESLPRRVRQMLLNAGYIIVSIDYRLAPETKLAHIMEDIEDALAWLYREGRTLFAADTRRVAVMGSSAGGYLTLASGYRVRPRPAALVSLWGYGDLIGDWYSRPSPHARHRRSVVTRNEAYRQVGGPAVANARHRRGDGGIFYQHCRQHGLWPRAVSGWNPHTEAERFLPYMPVHNVTAQYPPTMLIHGTADTDVPYEQSVMMARQLDAHGVEGVLVTMAGAEHGLHGVDPAEMHFAYETAVAFVDRYLNQP